MLVHAKLAKLYRIIPIARADKCDIASTQINRYSSYTLDRNLETVVKQVDITIRKRNPMRSRQLELDDDVSTARVHRAINLKNRKLN